jgi:carbon storage regulator
MLVLSRKSQESVVVGGTSELDRKLVVTVLGTKGGKVQLGFDAPADVPVHRLEVWERIQLNAAAGGEEHGSKTERASDNSPRFDKSLT